MAATIRVIRREPNGTIISEVTIAGVNDISTTDTSSAATVKHMISTTVTGSAATVADWINTTRQAYTPHPGTTGYQVVGLEVAFQPSGDIALLQLCVRDRCLIYQLLHRDTSTPKEFLEFLYDARFCYAGCDVDMITEGLDRAYNFSVRHTMDLGGMAVTMRQQEDLRQAGLERLARELMHLEMETPEEVQRSAWWQRELTDEQITYACANAFIASELGRKLAD